MTGVQGKVQRAFQPAGETAGKQFGNSFSKLATDPLVNFGDKILKGTLIAGTVAAGAAIIKNIGGAINRIDTLVAFPRVLEAMGASSEQAAKATDTLSKRLQGLPTSLQEGAASVQSLVSAGLGVEQATDVFLAFNNATLAASVDAGTAQGAFMQLTQAISKGKIDGQEWNSIVSAMPTAFQALSKETGKSREELRELYRTNPEQLLADLTRLDKEGGGGLASLEEQARAATGGIGTAFDNLNNAITRGMESIAKEIGGGDLEAGQKKISDGITAIGKAFGDALVNVGKFIGFVQKNWGVFGPIIAAIGAFVGVLVVLAATVRIVTAAKLAWAAITAVIAAPIVLIVAAIAALAAGLIYFFTQTELGKNIWQGFVSFLGTAWAKITGFFTGAWNIIKSLWSGVVSFFAGVWNGIVAVFSAVGSWFGNVFQGAWNAIKNVFSTVGSFFRGVWNTIVGIFGTVGTAVGNAIGNSFKSVVNSVISGAVNIINGFINGINGAINLINKIPGVNIGKLGKLPVPQLAEGGVVTKPTLAMIGEGRESEAVIPLSKLDAMLNGGGGGAITINQTNTVTSELDMNLINRNLTWELGRA